MRKKAIIAQSKQEIKSYITTAKYIPHKKKIYNIFDIKKKRKKNIF